MNKLQVTMAAQLLVEAYKKVAKELLRGMPAGCTRVKEVRYYSEAPSTLDEMRSCIRDNGGVLLIAGEGCGDSIYGHTGNVWFRAMHDLGHLTFDMRTTYDDEVALSDILWQLVLVHIPSEFLYDCCAVYFADTIGQSMHADEYGCFPADQVAFVREMCRRADEQTNWGLSGYRELVRKVHAALAAQNAPDLHLYEFARTLAAHNQAVRQYKATVQRLALAANRFMRSPQYPYGPEVLHLERLD